MNKPPQNPGLRELVQSKRQGHYRQTADDGRRGFRGWHERGYLPHFDAPGRIQFVTFRPADSLPLSRRSEWAALLQLEDDYERHRRLEAYLDLGYGEAYLRHSNIARVVESALLFFHPDRYDLRAWVVMPNHVHALFKVSEISMERIIETWKSFTAKKVNDLLGRRGQLWQPGYWDTYMRGPEHESRTVRYIESNPVRAKLVRQSKDWAWSSARYRDEFARLDLLFKSAGRKTAAGRTTHRRTK